MPCFSTVFANGRSAVVPHILVAGLTLFMVPFSTMAAPPRIISFTADSDQLPVGGRPWLSWETAGADKISLSPGIGDVTEFTDEGGSGNGVPTVPVSLFRYVDLNEEWLFVDDGDDLSDKDWIGDSFDDSGWLEGAAPLGYGDPVATALEFGPDTSDKFITYYFRKFFEAGQENIDATGVLYLELQRDDGVAVYLNGVEIIRDNLPEAELDGNTLSVFPTAGDAETQIFRYVVDKSLLQVGTNILSAEVHQTAANSSDLIFDAGLYSARSTAPVSMVEFNSTWRYLDNGSDQTGTGWQNSNFDDTEWNEGTGEFGYDSTIEATLLDFGGDPNNKHITYYFRRKFLVGNVAGIRELTANLLYDDGAIVYINGVEVARTNLPDGAVSSDTVADSASEEGIYEALDLGDSIPFLLNGENTLAVEIHQADPASSDVSFDMDLIALDAQGTEEALVSQRALWIYDDTGVDRGASDQDPDLAWFGPLFDDSSWNSGPAELGYGDGDGNTFFPTLLSYGPDPANKPVTTYFRRQFEVDSTILESLDSLNLSILRDDSAVVYLNGQEVVRDNLDEGEIDFETLALGSSSTTTNWTLNSELLSPGSNTIAVEIHQQDPASTDLLFDLRLIGISASDSITYTLSATNEDGTTTADVSVNYLPVIDGSPLPSAPIFLETTQPAGTDWEFASMWSDRQVPSAGKDYIVVGNFAATVRSPDGVIDPDFGGNLTLAGPRSRLILNHGNGSTARIPLLTIENGSIWHSRASAYLQVGEAGSTITIQDSASFNHASVSGRRVLAIGSNLAGNGTITVNGPDPADASTATLFLGDGTGFSGDWFIFDTVSAVGKEAVGSGNITIDGVGALDFDYHYYNPEGTLTLVGSTSQLVVDHNISVGTLTVRGLELPAGTYEGVAIEALGQNFVDRGGRLIIGGSNPDSDEDGLDDGWEQTFFGSLEESGENDSDGDGASNASEQIAGTDPTDSSSTFRLTIEELPGADGMPPFLNLSWFGLSSRSYFVQISEDLINWRVVSLIPGADGTTTYEDSVNFPPAAGDLPLYYRVVISGS